MVQEAEENAEADKKAKELIEARNQAEASLHTVKKDFDAYQDQLTEEEKTAYQTALDAVNTAMAGEDVEAIQKAVQSFFEAANPLTAKKQAAEQAKAQAEAQPQAAEQTVDASFTEVDPKEEK